LRCPMRGRARQGRAGRVAPLVQFAAHKPNEWLFHGHWWRPGPWSDHVIHGVVNPQGPGAMFRPWGAEWLRYCAAKYRSFDPASGTYVAWQGERRVCR